MQYVPFHKRAWHAGESCYAGCPACNDYSIGIELEGQDEEAYTPQQYRRLVEVAGALIRAFPELSLERIAGHSDIAPQRKTDPGPFFEWERFRSLIAVSE